MKSYISIPIGAVFGSLTVIGNETKYNGRHYSVPCLCVCGNTKLVSKSPLLNGITDSCGCRKREHQRMALTTHGLSEDKTHNTWRHMKMRCLNPNAKSFPDYGGRGITICNRWQVFEAFLEDMGNPPTDKHTIERRDNNRGYSPDNCYWATVKEQANNRRSNVYVDFQGKIQTLTQWSEELGIPYGRLLQRYYRGWSTERLLGK